MDWLLYQIEIYLKQDLWQHGKIFLMFWKKTLMLAEVAFIW